MSSSSKTTTTSQWKAGIQETADDMDEIVNVTVCTLKRSGQGTAKPATESLTAGVDLEAELDNSMKQLLTGINVDTEKWTELNRSTSMESSATNQVSRE